MPLKQNPVNAARCHSGVNYTEQNEKNTFKCETGSYLFNFIFGLYIYLSLIYLLEFHKLFPLKINKLKFMKAKKNKIL